MGIFLLLFFSGVGTFILWLILALLGLSKAYPTVLGVLISALFGVLPIYLILCFFGIMGNKK